MVFGFASVSVSVCMLLVLVVCMLACGVLCELQVGSECVVCEWCFELFFTYVASASS